MHAQNHSLLCASLGSTVLGWASACWASSFIVCSSIGSWLALNEGTVVMSAIYLCFTCKPV